MNDTKYRILCTCILSGIIMFFGFLALYNLHILLFEPNRIKEGYQVILYHCLIKCTLTCILAIFTLIINIKRKSLIIVAILILLSSLISII